MSDPAKTDTRPAPAEEVGSGLDGLRGWLAELDRIVGVRARVGLVLLAIGIGTAAAAAYLAIDTRSDGASEQQLQELRREVGNQMDAASAQAGGVSSQVARLRTRLRQLSRQMAAAGKRAGEPARSRGEAADRTAQAPPGGELQTPAGEG